MILEHLLSDQILFVCAELHKELGHGLLEKVYRNGIYNKLQKRNIPVSMEKNYKILNDGALLGNYFADLVVDNKIIVEVKVVSRFTYGMEAQLIHYLKISGLKVGYLVNFKNDCFDWKRVVQTR